MGFFKHRNYVYIPTTVILSFLVIFTSVLKNTARAEESRAILLDPIIITASHVPSALYKTPNGTIIISRNEIEARLPSNMIDLLRLVPGLHIDQAGGRGGVSSLYLRGSDPNFTVVLIDGIKMNDPNNSRGGSFDISTLDPGSIERIEIIRGPLSFVYGPDAMGGVVNIITRHGSISPETTVDIGVGTKGGIRTGFEKRGPLGAADYALNLSYVDDGSPVVGSAFVSENINTKIIASPSNTTGLELVLRYSDSHSESFPDDSGGPTFSVLRKIDERDSKEFTIGMAFVQDLFPWWTCDLKSNFYSRKEETVSPGVRDPFGIPKNSSENQFRRSNFVLNNHFSPIPSTHLSLGVDLQLEEGTSDGTLDFGGGPIPIRFEQDRRVIALFFEAEYLSPIGLTIEGGLRRDDPEGLDAEVSPRAGVFYRINATKTTLKAHWGEGFKLPSFFALGNPIVGNPSLVPETSRGFELGFVQDLFSGQMVFSGTFFKNNFFDLIDFDEGPPPQLINRSEVETKGFEIELSMQTTSQLSIDSHLSYTKTNIIGTDEDLRNRPKWRGGITTRWKPRKNISTHLSILHVGKVHDSSIATGDRILDDYVRVDVTTSWTI